MPIKSEYRKLDSTNTWNVSRPSGCVSLELLSKSTKWKLHEPFPKKYINISFYHALLFFFEHLSCFTNAHSAQLPSCSTGNRKNIYIEKKFITYAKPGHLKVFLLLWTNTLNYNNILLSSNEMKFKGLCITIAHISNQKRRHKMLQTDRTNLGGDLVWFVEEFGSQNLISIGHGTNFAAATLFR